MERALVSGHLAWPLLAAACASAPDAEPQRPPPSRLAAYEAFGGADGPAPGVSGSAEPTPPPPTKSVPLDVRLVTLRVLGPEQRLLAATLRGSLPAIKACAPTELGQGFWLDVSLTVDAAGASSELKLKSEAPGVTECVQKVLSGLAFEPRKNRNAVTIDAGIRFTTVDETGRDTLTSNDNLFRNKDGTCLALGVVDCPRNKMCAAPKSRPVLCPTEFGLPKPPDPGASDRRLDVSISGGKPGQGLERVALLRTGERCSLLKEISAADPVLSPTQIEIVDAPCADFDEAWSFAKLHFGGKKPKGKTNTPHAVTRAVVLSQMGPDSVPLVDDVRWTGEGPLDGPFGELATKVAKAAKKRGALPLSRFVD